MSKLDRYDKSLSFPTDEQLQEYVIRLQRDVCCKLWRVEADLYMTLRCKIINLIRAYFADLLQEYS